MTDQEKREKLIQTIIEMCEKNNEPVTREEAEDMADMEIKANGLPCYTQSDVEKKPRKKREVKKDENKIKLINALKNFLTTVVDDVIIVNEQREISFKIGTDVYSLVLTKHRPKKGV